MIPYFLQPVLHLGPFEIHAFGVLVVVAVLVGGRMILRRAHGLGIPVAEMFRFCFCMYACGMIGAHLAKTAMDNAPAFLADPSIVLRTSSGVRSVGGLSGGFLGGLLWCRFRRLSFFETLRRLDIVAYALPVAWMIGRLGCALAHDHRGLPSSSWIAVRFPEGPRYDLGLIEFLFLIGLAVTFRALDRRPRPVGFFFGLYGVLYGGFRIWLDTLHLQPMRFYGGAVGVILGVLGWIAMLAFERSRKQFKVQSAKCSGTLYSLTRDLMPKALITGASSGIGLASLAKARLKPVPPFPDAIQSRPRQSGQH
jgi:phosphatidylglycerol---prolipoprotein diacylglyceryl transferase